MRRVFALFDAPVPAQRAVAALLAAGVDPADVWSVPRLPRAGGLATQCLAAETDLVALRQALGERDVPAERLEVYVDGVRRGAILVLVEVPTQSAGVTAQILGAAGAADPDELRARWTVQRATTYDWRAMAAPDVDPPTA